MKRWGASCTAATTCTSQPPCSTSPTACFPVGANHQQRRRSCRSGSRPWRPSSRRRCMGGTKRTTCASCLMSWTRAAIGGSTRPRSCIASACSTSNGQLHNQSPVSLIRVTPLSCLTPHARSRRFTAPKLSPFTISAPTAPTSSPLNGASKVTTPNP